MNRDDALKSNPRLLDFIAKVKAAGGAAHLWGLVSDGGVHSHIDHIVALAKAVAASGLKVWLHAVTDGRDTDPHSGKEFMKRLAGAIPLSYMTGTDLKTGKGGDIVKGAENIGVATISGRYYAMDRNKTWERTKLAYDVMVEGCKDGGFNPLGLETVMELAYSGGESDEFVRPMPALFYPGMKDGDGLLVANFRADRVRQIADALA
ncbi:MAG: hypothetical protein LBO78_01315, partial [Rickettsiales bacterium]|nr:hypothetical protein [Rickettsiales bacterium]